jgi:hypothetical protein
MSPYGSFKLVIIMARNLKDKTKKTVKEWNVIPGSMDPKWLSLMKAQRMIVKFKNFTTDKNLAIYTGDENCGPQLMEFIVLTVCGGRGPKYYGYIKEFSIKLPEEKIFPIKVLEQEENKKGDLVMQAIIHYPNGFLPKTNYEQEKNGTKITIVMKGEILRNIDILSTKYLKRTIKDAPFY